MPVANRDGGAPCRGEHLTVAAGGQGAVRRGLMSGHHFRDKPVRYTEVHGRAFFEGDIHLGDAGAMAARARRGDRATRGVVISGERFRWTEGIVPYDVDRSLAADDPRVRQAIEHWQQATAIVFVQRTARNRSQHPDYLLFGFFEDACWSSVGRQGGEQLLSVGSGCAAGNVIHELGHALGLWHEQSREDRARFVTVVAENILPSMEHNFDQHVRDGDDLGEYDYQSIMHYLPDAFSRNGEPTLVPTRPGVQIGQRQGLSPGDCRAIGAMYAEQIARRRR
jgi:hypothetical protein